MTPLIEEAYVLRNVSCDDEGEADELGADSATVGTEFLLTSDLDGSEVGTVSALELNILGEPTLWISRMT